MVRAPGRWAAGFDNGAEGGVGHGDCSDQGAENGATVAELEAILGWHGGGMAAHYVKDANRARLSPEVIHRLATSKPAPMEEVRASEPKGK